MLARQMMLTLIMTSYMQMICLQVRWDGDEPVHTLVPAVLFSLLALLCCFPELRGLSAAVFTLRNAISHLMAAVFLNIIVVYSGSVYLDPAILLFIVCRRNSQLTPFNCFLYELHLLCSVSTKFPPAHPLSFIWVVLRLKGCSRWIS